MVSLKSVLGLGNMGLNTDSAPLDVGPQGSQGNILSLSGPLWEAGVTRLLC